MDNIIYWQLTIEKHKGTQQQYYPYEQRVLYITAIRVYIIQCKPKHKNWHLINKVKIHKTIITHSKVRIYVSNNTGYYQLLHHTRKREYKQSIFNIDFFIQPKQVWKNSVKYNQCSYKPSSRNNIVISIRE